MAVVDGGLRLQTPGAGVADEIAGHDIGAIQGAVICRRDPFSIGIPNRIVVCHACGKGGLGLPGAKSMLAIEGKDMTDALHPVGGILGVRVAVAPGEGQPQP